jgi:4-amino-4-deoxy-L-arabinose transferase-like glycosyltransferase
MYYSSLDDVPAWQKETAIEAWRSKPTIEPQIFEAITAITYKVVGQEVIWIPRIYSSLFWLIGGFGLYLLARELGGVDGAVVTLIFFVFMPFGIIASRSFQPDPFMIMWVTLAWLAFILWRKTSSWKHAILTGAFAGAAMLVKSVAVFMLLGGMLVVVLVDLGIKKTIRNGQVWVIGLMSGLPVGIYTLHGVLTLGLEKQFQGRFFPELLLDPGHYVRWVSEMMAIVGYSGLIIGLIGIFIFRNASHQAFLLGLWCGYVVYGLVFPYHFLTHNYYHLPLIPLVALSITPVADSLFNRISDLHLRWWSKAGVILVILFGILLQIWDVRVELAKNDYRHEPKYWEDVASKVNHKANIVALTQDYGDRITYYGWHQVNNWPETAHLAYRELRGGKPLEFGEWFQEQTLGMDYFLVTRLKELDRQPELKNELFNNYEIYEEGEGFIYFDLNKPMR